MLARPAEPCCDARGRPGGASPNRPRATRRGERRGGVARHGCVRQDGRPLAGADRDGAGRDAPVGAGAVWPRLTAVGPASRSSGPRDEQVSPPMGGVRPCQTARGLSRRPGRGGSVLVDPCDRRRRGRQTPFRRGRSAERLRFIRMLIAAEPCPHCASDTAPSGCAGATSTTCAPPRRANREG